MVKQQRTKETPPKLQRERGPLRPPLSPLKRNLPFSSFPSKLLPTLTHPPLSCSSPFISHHHHYTRTPSMPSASSAFLTPTSLDRSPKSLKEKNRMSSSSSSSERVDNWVAKLPHGLAVFTAETIAYLVFSNSLSLSNHALSNPSSPHHLPVNLPPSRIIHPLSPSPSNPPSNFNLPQPALHLWPSREFVDSVEMILKTTQVSAQVVLMAILFIDRFKKSSPMSGERGSELRLLVVGLLLANKTLDDSAYTNKTWSEVSHIDLEDLNRMERQFLLGIAFDLWTSTDEFKAWLLRLDDLQKTRRDAIEAFRPHQSVASPAIPYFPFSSSLHPSLNLNPYGSSQRPTSSSSSIQIPSLHLPLDPSPSNPPPPHTNLVYPGSFVQRPQQHQRVPQMSMAQLQIGSSSSKPQDPSHFVVPSSSRLPLPPPHQQPQLQQPTYPYPPITVPMPTFMTQQPLQTRRISPHHGSSSSSNFVPPPPPSHSSIPTIATPRSNKRPAGDAFSSPPHPSSYETNGVPPPKRQHRSSFDSSAVSTPSNPYPQPPLQPQQVVPLLPRVMGGAGSSTGGETMFPGSQIGGFGGQVVRGGGGRGSVQWPSMQDYAAGAGGALYAPLVYQARDANGVVQLYVQTIAASPLSSSPSYLTYRKAHLKVQPAPSTSHQPQQSSSSSQPRYSSNLSQPPSNSYLYPYPYAQSQPTAQYLHPASHEHQQQHLPKEQAPSMARPASSSWTAAQPTQQQQQQQQQGLVNGEGGAPSHGMDWDGLEKWRRGVVSSPVTE
ncbi:cyclin-domain-containing protein [Mrakia frigida]|uniref:cyclin family protein n=1 Tax=Mrakia frigida TaxID=29902 RepID=UPI003FCBF30D